MKTAFYATVARIICGALRVASAGVLCLVAGGCCSQFAFNAIPANRLPCELQGECRNARRPIDFSLLSQAPPEAYRLGPGDTVAIYIQDILPPERESLPLMQGTFLPNPVYFPANGLLNTPAVGVPVTIQSDGTVPLPLVEPIDIEGMTLQEATQKIRQVFTVDKGLLQPGRERILLTLLRPRVNRVLVLRDDTESGQMVRTINREEQVLARRGSAQAVDLPAFQNDVLHALLATGGLPGVDAYSECWILHGTPADFSVTQNQINGGEAPAEVMKRFGATRHIVRVPLRVVPEEPLPFTQDDVILQNGDIVYIETRQTEFFYTGGLLAGGQIPLPRDYDIDVVAAISMANAGVAGPPGTNANNLPVFRSGPGNIIPPTRVLILRTLPNGEQIKIRVNLNEAMNNPKERIRILPGDVVMLHYKPHEVVGNTFWNLVSFNISYVPGAN